MLHRLAMQGEGRYAATLHLSKDPAHLALIILLGINAANLDRVRDPRIVPIEVDRVRDWWLIGRA